MSETGLNPTKTYVRVFPEVVTLNNAAHYFESVIASKFEFSSKSDPNDRYAIVLKVLSHASNTQAA